MASFTPPVVVSPIPRAPRLSSPAGANHARRRPVRATLSPLPVPPQHSGSILDIESVPELLAAVAARPETLLVLEAYSNGCRPCIGMRRAYRRAAETFAGRARFARVNVDEVPEVREHLDVRGLPFFVFYKNGVRIDHFASASVDRLEESILDNE